MIYGNVGIVQQLTSLSAVDEYHLLVHPVILGSGKRLFDDINDQKELSLKAFEKFASGVQLLIYSTL